MEGASQSAVISIEVAELDGQVTLYHEGEAWDYFISPVELNLVHAALADHQGPARIEFGLTWPDRVLVSLRHLAPRSDGQIDWDAVKTDHRALVYKLRVAQWGYEGLKLFQQAAVVAKWGLGKHAEALSELVEGGFRRLGRGLGGVGGEVGVLRDVDEDIAILDFTL